MKILSAWSLLVLAAAAPSQRLVVDLETAPLGADPASGPRGFVTVSSDGTSRRARVRV